MASNKKILLIGASGLVGSKLKEILSNGYQAEASSMEQGFDITDPNTMQERFEEKFDYVIHLAAKADVDGCEKDMSDGKNGVAWKINVIGAQNVAEMCKKTGSRMIYISTDFVFDGTKVGEYFEDDVPNPINWYSKTKYEGELAVQRVLDNDVVIARIAYPYRKNFDQKLDFVRLLIDKLQNNQEIKAVTDHFISPTYIDDVGHALDIVIANDESGVFHIVGSGSITPFEAASLIQEKLGKTGLVKKTTREEFFRDRAPRPYNLALNNDKITRLGAQMNTFESGLDKILI